MRLKGTPRGGAPIGMTVDNGRVLLKCKLLPRWLEGGEHWQKNIHNNQSSFCFRLLLLLRHGHCRRRFLPRRTIHSSSTTVSAVISSMVSSLKIFVSFISSACSASSIIYTIISFSSAMISTTTTPTSSSATISVSPSSLPRLPSSPPHSSLPFER